jgi:exopolysaccharide biosynthesis polyprenyl glycosylphosphotransferase
VTTFTSLDIGILLLTAAVLAGIGLVLQRLSAAGIRRLRSMDGVTAYPRETVLRAQRQFGILAFSIAPAVAAGMMAGNRLGSAGDGTIVAVAICAVSLLLLERGRIPLHLMPLASTVVRTAVPMIGIALALATFALAGQPEVASEMLVPLVGAWIVTAFATWIHLRFEMSHQVRVAIIGSPGLATGLAHELTVAGIRSHTVVGWLADDSVTAEAGGEPRWLGSLEQLREVVERHSIELLVHSNGAGSPDEKPHRSRLELFERVAAVCLDQPVHLLETTQLYEDLLGHVPLGQSNSAWFQYLLHPRFRAGSLAFKRIFDVVVACTMLVLLAPVLVAFAIMIKLTDGGPVFYRQRRVGERGCEFEMIKLRSMRADSEEVDPHWSVADDNRVTPVGRIMRRLHIDEMPQLWNVLRGEMTIVGPRPERRQLIVELERQLAYYDRRHLVQPGLAGWAQARCGYSGSEEGTSWKLCHDLFYLKHRSVYFDFLILLENVRISLRSGVQFGLPAPQEQFIIGSAGPASQLLMRVD